MCNKGCKWYIIFQNFPRKFGGGIDEEKKGICLKKLIVILVFIPHLA
jgi:hypothetical protein